MTYPEPEAAWAEHLEQRRHSPLKIGINRLDSTTVELYIEICGLSKPITPQEARFIAKDLEGMADSAEKGRAGTSVTRP